MYTFRTGNTPQGCGVPELFQTRINIIPSACFLQRRIAAEPGPAYDFFSLQPGGPYSLVFRPAFIAHLSFMPDLSEACAGLSRIQIPGRGQQGVQRLLRGAPQGRHVSTSGGDDGGAVCHSEGGPKTPCFPEPTWFNAPTFVSSNGPSEGCLDLDDWKIRLCRRRASTAADMKKKSMATSVFVLSKQLSLIVVGPTSL